MPPVGDLGGLWCSGTGGLGDPPGPVAADDSDLRMPVQPDGDGLGETVLQDVDGVAGLHVDQHGGVGAPLAFGPLIDAQHGDRADLRFGQGTDQPDQGVAGDGDAQQGQQT